MGRCAWLVGWLVGWNNVILCAFSLGLGYAFNFSLFKTLLFLTNSTAEILPVNERINKIIHKTETSDNAMFYTCECLTKMFV